MKKLLFVTLLAAMLSNCTSKEATETQVEAAEQSETATEDLTKTVVSSEGFDYTGELLFPPTRILPVDESKKDASLRKTLDDLLVIIKNKDTKALLPYLDAGVRASAGDDEGVEDFVAFWDLKTKPQKSELWGVLQRLIEMGGKFQKDSRSVYSMPYISDLPENFDYLEYAVITGEKVNIREKPSSKAKLVRQLTHEVVKRATDGEAATETIGGETHDWQKIQMADGSTGYVWSKFMYSPIDFGLGLAKVRDEGWKITYLVGGI